MRTNRLLALFAPLLALAGAAPAGAQSPAVDADGEARMLMRINDMRAAEELPPLARDDRLDAAARAHSVDMAAHQQLVHVSQRTGDPAQRVREAGASTVRIAENISRHANTAGAFAAILQSDAHRLQLLDPGFTHIGLAAVSGPDGIYVTQVLAELAPPPAEPPPPAVAEAAPAAQPEAVTPPPPALETEPDEAPEAPAAPPAPEAPAAQQGSAAQAPSAQAPSAQAPSAQATSVPTMRMPRTHRRVAGYWIQHGGRWWYFPVPPRATAGQVLYPDPNVQGPPPGYRPRPNLRSPAAPPPPVRYRTQPQTPPQQRRTAPGTTIYWY